MEKKPQQILERVFGYSSFKPLQREVIDNVLHKSDTLVIMPTGGGKSLCYQIPALIFDGLTVVISPLISLMKDQVRQLIEFGVPAVFLNSSLSVEEYQENVSRVLHNQVRLLYISPESLLNPSLLALLSNVEVDCLTVDEAHCISQWGHDFRPEYRQLVGARERFPEAVCLALTATATPRVRADIRQCLHFNTSGEFVASFNRENLFLEVIPKRDAVAQTIQFIQRFPNQSGIIYCFTRRQVDELAEVLQGMGFSVRPYHAGLSDEDRKLNQELFIRDDVQIIVATIAFGMGINKPNVRFVVHYDLPQSIENYYQEIGRSGRDGLPAHCLLLYNYADKVKLQFIIENKDDPQQRRIAQLHLGALVSFAESDVCRRIGLLRHFGEAYQQDNCGMCDNCCQEGREQVDITVPAQMFLSCVKRTGERFGFSHVAHVLRGSMDKKVLQHGHQNLSTHGIGKDISHKQWLRLGSQLLNKGLLERDAEFGGLKLTQKAYEFLKGSGPLYGFLEREQALATAHGLEARAERGEAKFDRELFELLRARRKALADAAGVPPSVIFHDRTLIEMATCYPRSLESLSVLYGVGENKLKKYAQAFLEAIAAYCDERGLQERSLRQEMGALSRSSMEQKPRHVEVGEMFNAGRSVEEIAAHFGVKIATVVENLYRYSQQGHTLRTENFFDLTSVLPEQQERVLAAFNEHGSQYLKPVYEALGQSISYDDLKVLRLQYLSRSVKEEG